MPIPRRRFLTTLAASSLAAPWAQAQFRVEIAGVGATQLPLALTRFRDEDRSGVALSAVAAFAYLPDSFAGLHGVSSEVAASPGDPRLILLGAVAIGVVLAGTILWLTGYYTGTESGPTMRVSASTRTGAATVILSGFGLGLESAAFTAGAIAVAMGAYLVLLPRGRILTVIATAAFQVVYVPAAVVLLLFFVTQFFTDPSESVAWEAHAAGMVAGALAALVLGRIPAVRQRARDDAADAALRTGTRF